LENFCCTQNCGPGCDDRGFKQEETESQISSPWKPSKSKLDSPRMDKKKMGGKKEEDGINNSHRPLNNGGGGKWKGRRISEIDARMDI